MTLVLALSLAMLGVAAALVLFRLYRGPSNLDRIVAAEILLVIVIAGVALESARQRTTTYLPLLMILGLVGFVGGVAVTRLLSRDSDEPEETEEPQVPDEHDPALRDVRQQPEDREQS
jgi:multicomponent Na+:H+ antiporter subunit F